MPGLEAVAPKLQKLLPLLGSDKDGEVLATVAAIRRTLDGAGANLHDLARALAAPRGAPSRSSDDDAGLIDALLGGDFDLTDWERDFVSSLSRLVAKGKRLSPKQRATLQGIAEECGL
ncbi:hypothetical protein [Pararhodospirillum oryzae]|uniref:Uncharacterized protein n=1 Tax=Pararhodospirillum oryzae TaxID=478448 RepID=A0A512HAW0_9PROT|nr:hypothetical protein [Pararhodospirillum oryzae]GEO82596.1 hypothetical protein ROR02_27270 [Pararhodospirillum oryzae]